MLHSDIQDGHLEILERASPSKTIMRIEPKLDGRHQSDIEIQNC